MTFELFALGKSILIHLELCDRTAIVNASDHFECDNIMKIGPNGDYFSLRNYDRCCPRKFKKQCRQCTLIPNASESSEILKRFNADYIFLLWCPARANEDLVRYICKHSNYQSPHSSSSHKYQLLHQTSRILFDFSTECEVLCSVFAKSCLGGQYTEMFLDPKLTF